MRAGKMLDDECRHDDAPAPLAGTGPGEVALQLEELNAIGGQRRKSPTLRPHANTTVSDYSPTVKMRPFEVVSQSEMF